MAGASGKNYKLQIADGTISPSDYTDVACQGDLTFNTGKTLEISRTKNCKHPFFREAGFNAAVTIELEAPVSATHTIILDAADNETEIDARVVSSDTGVPRWTGRAFVSYDPITMPTEGIATASVLIAWVNDPIRDAS